MVKAVDLAGVTFEPIVEDLQGQSLRILRCCEVDAPNGHVQQTDQRQRADRDHEARDAAWMWNGHRSVVDGERRPNTPALPVHLADGGLRARVHGTCFRLQGYVAAGG